jgi:hypothetical protein
MIEPSQTCLFIPANLKTFKLALFNRIGDAIKRTGGQAVRGDIERIAALSDDVTPIIGCSPELRGLIDAWIARGRDFIYWDRGYARRVFATWLPRGEAGGYYRWHRNSYQMRIIAAVPDDRWKALKTEVRPWAKRGRHIVIAAPTPTYSRFHALKDWTDLTLDRLSRNTDRQVVIRGKETKRPLQHDLEGAHALVAHGSNAAVEAVVMGCPVFVDPSSAAALVGKIDLTEIERPAYPDRQPWLNALAYSQFNETELVDGTLWRLLV